MTRKDDARLRLCLRLHHRFKCYQSYNRLINHLDKYSLIDINAGLQYINANTQLPAITRIINGTSTVAIDLNNYHLNYNLNKAKLTMCGRIIK
ncbi:MAG: hypothetical protein EZS28_042431 [Streblomastix strix]|uniref:Uncharacterized protein n=1 Tax=Streblomastix strix TaxID=222440 RepID=A0A5J4TVU4_9EUKA|nr:MAG: hypothetical protein EZS28_042431 [Streblomastix strix]